MAYVRFNNDWQYNGCRVLRLESDLLRLDVLPELGGRILHWVYKPLDRDWLWQNPRVKAAVLPPGADYNDTWAGGWDELFPNCTPCTCDGEVYPDHGEYWTRPCEWCVEPGESELTLHLSLAGAATPTRWERWIMLKAGSPAVRLRHRLTHLGRHGFHFIWALHPGFAVQPGCELIIPAGRGVIASPGLGRLANEPLEFRWPNVPARSGGTIDFSKVPPPTTEPGYEMVYLTELLGGWFAVHDPATRSGFGLSFDHKLFNCIWVFASHGGWRGLHVTNIEPATGWPTDLPEAVRRGQCRRLEPGQTIETHSTAVVFTDRDRITGINADGVIA